MNASGADLAPLYVDTHCHIDLYPDPSEILKVAARERVAVVAVTNTPSVFQVMERLATTGSDTYPALGLHPELAHERESELPLFENLIPRTRFIGEVGLDGTVGNAFRESQERVFRTVLDLCARTRDKVLTVHSRRASGRVLDVLSLVSPGAIILHWFSGSKAEAARAIAIGCYFSVNPAMVGSRAGQELVRFIPRDRVLTETDGPFVNVDTRPAEPTDVKIVVDRLAGLWATDEEAAREVILDNFRRCIALPNSNVPGSEPLRN